MTIIQLRWHHFQDETARGRLVGALPLRIGRSQDNELVLEDALKSVSRQHAVLMVDDGKVVVQDVGSTNGLYVNGRSTTQAAIDNHAELIIGGYFLNLEIQPQNPPKCSNPECGREIMSDDPMCQWCGRFVADAVTREGLFV